MAKMVVFKRIKETAFISFLLSMIVHIGTSFIVRREVDPTFVPTPSNVTVHEGDLAVLKCHIERLGPKMVVWRKLEDDYPLTIGTMTFGPGDEMTVDHSKLSKSSSTWDLHIKNVKAHHAGVYECQVTANHLIAQYVTLNVLKQAAVKSTINIKGTKYVDNGDAIVLMCNATLTAQSQEEVDWFFEGNRIHQNDKRFGGRVQILRYFTENSYISKLIIEKSRVEDKGIYICRSSNLNVQDFVVHVLNPEPKPTTNSIGKREKEGQPIIQSPHSLATTSQTFLLPVCLSVVIVHVLR